MHPGQAKIESEATRFNAVACGRRWGKSKYLTRRMALRALKGETYGYFAPTYKILTEVFNEAAGRLSSVGKVLKSEKRIELATNGLIEFWTLEDADAGRSRRYHEVGIDEAGLVKDLETRWHQAIRPTLTDFKGEAWLAGTPKGRNFFWNAFSYGQDPLNLEWSSWRMPTETNPYIDPSEIEAARLGMPERSFQQEFLAEFLDEAGGVFRGVREVVQVGRKSHAGKAASIGIDIARIEDFTVLTAMDAEGVQLAFKRFNQISWERIYGEITEFAKQFQGCPIWLDATGAGDPVYERVKKDNPGHKVNPFVFTNSSKEGLIDNLAMRIEQKNCELLDIPEQTNELLAYQYELTPSRNVRMNAPEGMHDDTVIALALAAWGINKRREIQFH